MMLLIRVTLAVVLGAAALWAQNPGTDSNTQSQSSIETNAAVLQLSDRGWFPGAPVDQRGTSEFPAGLFLGLPLPGGLAPRTASEPRPLSEGIVLRADGTAPLPLPAGQASPQNPPPRRKAITYSDAYLLKRKIHRYASFATAPLFVAEIAVGQKLYNSGSRSLRSVHSGLATGIAVLFGVNSVTGAWNLWEARKDPNGRGKRMLHGILMLGADAGFVATGALAPGDNEEGRLGGSGNRRSVHRTVALTSMGIAAFSYLYMWLAR